MLSSKSLLSLKGMLPTIHQPLPLNQREAQKFLNALTSSFREHLDREHGWLNSDATPAARHPPRPSPHAARSTRDNHRRPTDRHLRAILSNPLFSYDPSLSDGAEKPRIKRDPLDVFDEAVARGLMTPGRAAGCLHAIDRDIIQSSALSIEEAKRKTGAGLKVIRWLRASGLERDLSFVAHTSLISMLLKFMVAEGLEDVAWGWIDRLMRGEGLEHQQLPNPASSLLDALITADTTGTAKSLDRGYASMLRGTDMFHDNPAFQPSFSRPWLHLARFSTVDAWKMSRPSESLYDAFVAVGEQLRIPRRGVERAHLDLHHPSMPSSVLAVRLLNNSSLWQQLSEKPQIPAQVPTQLPGYRKIMFMGLDAVQHLTQAGKMEEAQSTLQLLKEKLDLPFMDRKSSDMSRLLATG